MNDFDFAADEFEDEQVELLEGEITGWSSQWGSGLAQLFIDGVPVHCDNACTVRALDGCFGGFISANNHCVDQNAIIGKRITYSVDALGILEGFSPVEEEG